MRTSYNEKADEIREALDGCGIGGNVREVFREAEKEISVLLADMGEKIRGQLVHNLLVNLPHGIGIGDEGAADHAIKSGVVSALGALVKWDIYKARRLAAGILQDVNDHGEAAKLFKLADGDHAEQPEDGGRAELIAALEDAARELDARLELIGPPCGTDVPYQRALAAIAKAKKYKG